MMVRACLQDRNESSTYYGNIIRQHQVLLGDEGTVKTFFIDAFVIT